MYVLLLDLILVLMIYYSLFIGLFVNYSSVQSVYVCITHCGLKFMVWSITFTKVVPLVPLTYFITTLVLQH